MNVRLQYTIERKWLRTDPLRVGDVPPGRGTPNAYVLVGSNDEPVMRIDVYSRDEVNVYDTAFVWLGQVVIGFGHRLILVDLKERAANTIDLGTYFCGTNRLPTCLIVTSATGCFRVEPDASIAWHVEGLGLDGVFVEEIGDAIIKCRALFDPDGGWDKHEIYLLNGHLLTDRGA